MSDLDEQDQWQAAQAADQRAQEQAAFSALVHARNLGLSDSECMAIAYSAGLATDFYREIRK